jgi:hypothetical protein
MHSFTDLIDRASSLTLDSLKEARDKVVEALQTSGATHLVKSLQMIQIQKAIMAVGMFSLFESILQDRLECNDGFVQARKCLESEGEINLKRRFLQFVAAINTLKHGRGRSYDTLLAQAEELPFRVKRLDESFFFEGDVSEIATLVEVDDAFVMGCAEVIRDVSNVIRRAYPGSGL